MRKQKNLLYWKCELLELFLILGVVASLFNKHVVDRYAWPFFRLFLLSHLFRLFLLNLVAQIHLLIVDFDGSPCWFFGLLLFLILWVLLIKLRLLVVRSLSLVNRIVYAFFVNRVFKGVGRRKSVNWVLRLVYKSGIYAHRLYLFTALCL